MEQRNRAMNLEISRVIEQLGLTSEEVTIFYNKLKEKYEEEEQNSEACCDSSTHKED